MTVFKRKKRHPMQQDIVLPIINGILLCILMFIIPYPVINTVAISFNDSIDAVRGGITLWPRKFITLMLVLTMYVNAGLIPNFLLISKALKLANSSAAKATPVTVRCAITVVSALPIMIVYPFLQRYFVTGMVLGGVKG